MEEVPYNGLSSLIVESKEKYCWIFWQCDGEKSEERDDSLKAKNVVI